MKKLLFGAVAVLAAATLLAGCENEKKVEPVEEPTVVETPAVVETPVVTEPEEQVGVGNTDEGMVALVVEDYLKSAFSGEIEEVKFNSIKVYTPEEVSGDPVLSELNLQEGEMAFEIGYELKIVEGVEDMMKFTAGTGDIDGQWIREKYNIGTLRNGENGYEVRDFGTSF